VVSAVDAGYTLTGAIDGLDSGWVYLLNREQTPTAPDSALIINGSFLFQGVLPEPTLYWLGVSNNGNKEYRLGFFLDNGQIHISGKHDSIGDAQITGSPAQDEYRNFLERRKPLEEEKEALHKRSITAARRKSKKQIDSLNDAMAVHEQKDRDFVSRYARQHPGSRIAAMAVYEKFAHDSNAVALENIYGQFEPAIRRSYFGRKIENLLVVARRTAIGSGAPGFAENDTAGRSISLSSFRGSYVLLDFWASWSAAYRGENRYRARAYRKYHSRGLEIVGVSLDTAREQWTSAIAKDRTMWIQVADLRGWDGPVVKLYGIRTLPSNFLIDREGKIIARDISGAALKTVLREQFK
jgi:peroxiredoxin